MKRTPLMAALLTGALLLVGCGGGGGGDPLAGGGSGGDATPADVVRVGSGNFTESQLLAEIYAQTLETAGLTVERQFNIGSREIYFAGLQDGSIDMMPEYTGVLLQYVDAGATQKDAEEVYTALQAAIPAPLTVLDRAEAENKDAVVVTAATAAQYGRSLADYGPACGQLVFGGPPEFQGRPDGIPGIAATYNCTFASYRSLDTGGPLTVTALEDGTIQAANLFTTDPTVVDKGFVILEDPQNNFAAQNIVPVINESKVTPEVSSAINAVTARLTTEVLVDLNRQLAAEDKPSVDVVAREWLGAAGS